MMTREQIGFMVDKSDWVEPNESDLESTGTMRGVALFSLLSESAIRTTTVNRWIFAQGTQFNHLLLRWPLRFKGIYEGLSVGWVSIT